MGLNATERDNEDGTFDGRFGSWVRNPPGYASYAILRHGEPMVVVERSPNPPTAKLTGITAGQRFEHDDTITLEVELADPDGDEPVYRLYYSASPEQGYEPLGRFANIDVDLVDPAVSFPVGGLPGSAQARLAVSVSDGVNSVFVETPAFQIPYHAPQVEIKTLYGAFGSPGDHYLEISARFQDRDEAEPQGYAVVWSSSLDGIIEPLSRRDHPGAQVITLQTGDFTEGTHTLTATVTDPHGLTGSHSVPMFIQHESYIPPPPPPPFDGVWDYADAQVGQTITIDVLANDTLKQDIGDTMEIDQNSRPELGTVEIVHDAEGYPVIEYTAHTPGEDQFRYRINTAENPNYWASARVTVSVSPAPAEAGG